VLDSYTKEGYRVIALATKVLPIKPHKALTIDRSIIESDLTFLGLLVMENRLKPETTPVIDSLN